MNGNTHEIIHKEIDLIQSCICRMAQNSFLLKGWFITALAALLAIIRDSPDPLFMNLAIFVPLVSFWYLDAFFLQKEKMYRKLYDWVIDKRRQNDFSRQYELDPNRFKAEVDSIGGIMLSSTLWVFYGIPYVIVMAIFIFRSIAKH